MSFPKVDWPHAIHYPSKKVKEEHLLLLLPTYPLSCPWAGTSNISVSGSQGFGLKLELPHWLPWASCLQMADCETSQFPWSHKPIPQNKSLHKYGLSICLLLVPFPWTSLINTRHVGLAPNQECPLLNALCLLNSPFCPPSFYYLPLPSERRVLVLAPAGQPGRCVSSEVSECGGSCGLNPCSGWTVGEETQLLLWNPRKAQTCSQSGFTRRAVRGSQF